MIKTNHRPRTKKVSVGLFLAKEQATDTPHNIVIGDNYSSYRKALHYAEENGVTYIHSSVLKEVKEIFDKAGYDTSLFPTQWGWYEVCDQAFDVMCDIIHNEGYYMAPKAVLREIAERADIAVNYKPEENPFLNMPRPLFNLLCAWAEQFGHEIHEDKGYIYYKNYYLKPFTLCNEFGGAHTYHAFAERGARLFVNFGWMGNAPVLKAANHRKGIEIDLITEINEYLWYKNHGHKVLSKLEG
jgi:hypothetical protein